MPEINLLDLYPRSSRPIEERGRSVTEAHREVARRFGLEYFDGDRLYGYGGYGYHPRFWTETVQRFMEHYHLAEDSTILDVGCAKGYMLFDLLCQYPGLTVAGIDVSQYAIDRAIEEVKPFLQVADAKDLPYEDSSFDLVISINTIHNLAQEECSQAIQEIQRVSRKHAFITVDAWRTEEERQRLMMWNLTALTYMHVDQWRELFQQVGYTGDYYWFIAE